MPTTPTRALLTPTLAFDDDACPVEPPILIEGDRVIAVGPEATRRAGDAERLDLSGRLLLPGLVNAHSHAFQRILRGRVETRSSGRPDDDFWSWRTRMYEAACGLSAEEFQLVATVAYLDMLRSGFTAVGEFHYVHHDEQGQPYPSSYELSRRIADASSTAGIRLGLLSTAYERAGADRPAELLQRRFIFPTVEAFLEHADATREAVVGETVSHGLALHSVRALSRGWIERIAAASSWASAPLHVHACEQRAELDHCEAEHGVGPLELLRQAGALDARTTVVHATHIDDADVDLLSSADSGVCLCPSTERNLGDGLCPIEALHKAGVSLSVGTDSHARIDALDELRSLEDHERLRTERRCVLVGRAPGLASAVLPAGTAGGRRALGLPPAGPAVGHVADFACFAVPWEAHAGPRASVDALVVGGGRCTDAFVGGRRVVKDGRSTLLDETRLAEDGGRVLKRLSAMVG